MEKKDHLSDDDEDKQNKQDAGCQDARWWWPSMDLRLAIVGVVVLAYAITEIVLGLAMHSIILKTDGFHNLGDAGGFVLAIIVSIIKAREQDKAKAERFSLIGGFVNASIILLITLCCGVEAVIELYDDPDPEIGPLYFVCAASGFFVKAFGALFLGGLEVNLSGIDHDHSHAHGAGYEPCSGHSDDTSGNGHTHGHGHTHGANPQVVDAHGHTHGFQEADAKGEHHPGHGNQGEEKLDANVYAVWLHSLQDAIGSLIVILAGLIVLYSGHPQAAKADALGAVIMVVFVWVTTMPFWLQCTRRLFYA